MSQPNERSAESLRLAGPGLGLGLSSDDTDRYLEAARKGVLIPETACDKGMQDNFALRPDTSVDLVAAS